jgi:hypothetical protein
LVGLLAQQNSYNPATANVPFVVSISPQQLGYRKRPVCGFIPPLPQASRLWFILPQQLGSFAELHLFDCLWQS